MSKRAISDHIRAALRNGDKFNFEQRIYIRLPSKTDHQSVHTLGKVSFACNQPKILITCMDALLYVLVYMNNLFKNLTHTNIPNRTWVLCVKCLVNDEHNFTPLKYALASYHDLSPMQRCFPIDNSRKILLWAVNRQKLPCKTHWHTHFKEKVHWF